MRQSKSHESHILRTLANLRSIYRDVYCHPMYASHMEGYGVDINAPEPPFVLFKVIYRACSASTVLGPLYVFARTLVRICSALAGYLVGFFSGPNDHVIATQATHRPPVSQDTRIPRPVWGPDLSLLDDEFL